jgi:hypothetical protein
LYKHRREILEKLLEICHKNKIDINDRSAFEKIELALETIEPGHTAATRRDYVRSVLRLLNLEKRTGKKLV